MTRVILPIVVRGACLCALIACSVDARVVDRRVPDEARLLPGDVTAYFSIEDAAQWRKMALGDPMEALLRAFLDREDTGEAWNRFAAELELDPNDAFDRVLGTRFTFAQRSEGMEDSSWVIISEVDRATEKLLRRSLKPVPREIRGGMPIMSLEDGRFNLAISAVGERSLVLFGPSDAPQLFNEITDPALQKGRESLAEQRQFVVAHQAAVDARAMLLMQVEDEPPGWIGVAGLPEFNSLELRVIMRSRTLAEATAGVEPWSRQLALDLDQESYLVATEWALPAEVDYSIVNALRPMLPGEARAFGRPELMRGRRVLVIDPSSTALARGALAFESSDVRALAPLADRLVAGVLDRMWGSDEITDVLDMGGQYPEAQRSVDLSDRLGRAMPWMFDEGPRLSWRFVDADDQRGWWTIGTDPEQLERLSAALEQEAPVRERPAPWVAVGVARPRALLDEIATRPVPIKPELWPPAALLERVSYIRWGLFRTPEGDLRGTIFLRFARARR